jgi:hypothetical protein
VEHSEDRSLHFTAALLALSGLLIKGNFRNFNFALCCYIFRRALALLNIGTKSTLEKLGKTLIECKHFGRNVGQKRPFANRLLWIAKWRGGGLKGTAP